MSTPRTDAIQRNKLKKEIKRLREALEFYADEDNYFEPDPSASFIRGTVTVAQADNGKRAREALAK